MTDATRDLSPDANRRRFNSSERAALFLVADGKCMSCRAELQPGWHADHVDPWSKGGDTDVINGQALCPPCNLKKGDRSMNLRDWQVRALNRLNSTDGDFLAVATPGGGKTTFALTAAQQFLLDRVQQVIVVVPTSHLRRQWSYAASRFGIDLDHTFTNGDGRPAHDMQGVAVTYAAVASAPHLYRKITSSAPTLVILDEIHHCSQQDNTSWGPALRQAFEYAERRILLSGTPVRSDKRAVPFVTYDESNQCVPSFDYSYGEALKDEGVVRPIEFLAWDGEVRWLNAGSVQPPVQLSEASDDELANALRSALHPDSAWIRSVLEKADEELTRHRSIMPDAGGLVVASFQSDARRYADMLERITGEAPILALSEDPEASRSIERFASSTGRWIVAVKMVSEGVDIPRLTCGVYATNIRTDVFVRQVVGRFIRTRDETDEMSSSLFIPSIEPLLRIATAIEHTVNEALADDVERERRDSLEEGTQERLIVDEPLPGSEAELHSTILGGQSYDQAEIDRAAEVARRIGLINISPAQAAAFARELMSQAPHHDPVPDAQIQRPLRTLADDKKAHRTLVQRLVGKLNRLTGEEHSHINKRLATLCGGPTKTATLAQLEHRIELLHGWIEAAR